MMIHDREFSTNLIALPFHEFDLILGIDWLSKHWVIVVCDNKTVEPLQRGASQDGQEDLTQQSIVPCLQSHYLAEVHKVIEGVLKTIVHMKFW